MSIFNSVKTDSTLAQNMLNMLGFKHINNVYIGKDGRSLKLSSNIIFINSLGVEIKKDKNFYFSNLINFLNGK